MVYNGHMEIPVSIVCKTRVNIVQKYLCLIAIPVFLTIDIKM